LARRWKALADEYDIPLLGQIPIVQSIREGGDEGIPVMMSDDEISKKHFPNLLPMWYVVLLCAMRILDRKK
jgi:ATP-binding protein involved in chromosome partitioning